MQLTPLKTFHDTTNHLFLFTEGQKKFLVKCYAGPKAKARWKLETEVLSLWFRLGYAVPACHPIQISAIDGPYIVMDYLEGISISEYLSDRQIPAEPKLDTLKSIFQNNAARHTKALELEDARLVQYDANTGNIVKTAAGCFHVDFETPPKNRPMADLVCKEIAKFCRWSVRDMGRNHLDDITRIVTGAYGQNRWLLERVVTLPTRRPFQFFHRRRDMKKKQNDPGEITKYDIADAFDRRLRDEISGS